jgi:hypothetical protein
VEAAAKFKSEDEARKEVEDARVVIVQHNPQSMFRLRNNEMDDDGKISEFLHYRGFKNVGAIEIDKVRAYMSAHGILHVWQIDR